MFTTIKVKFTIKVVFLTVDYNEMEGQSYVWTQDQQLICFYLIKVTQLFKILASIISNMLGSSIELKPVYFDPR